MKAEDVKVCLVSSHGGHLHELTEATRGVVGRKYWVTHRTGHTAALLAGEPHYFVIDPVKSKAKFALNAMQSLWHLLCERPRVIISTGSGIAIASMLLGKWLLGSKLIYVESAASVVDPSRTGRFMYRHADLFLIQWEGLRRFYPNAKYVGVL